MQLVGYPEAFAIRALTGKPLSETLSFSFLTLPDGDPQLFEDQVPSTGPLALSASPGEVAGDPGANAAVLVKPADGSPVKVVMQLSENLDPCTVNPNTVIFSQYEVGIPTSRQGSSRPTGT